jgi:pyruvate/2-oxoglutarate dehydrogenase complex dihydrolipoamide dehydrogenase (E3) component
LNSISFFYSGRICYTSLEFYIAPGYIISELSLRLTGFKYITNSAYMKKFDAIIIGSGQAGKPLALALAKEGWKTALIEERFIGGTCINYGCTPTKAMIGSARAAYIMANSDAYGIKAGKHALSLKAIVKRKDKIVSGFRKGSRESLEKQKNIKLFFGTASFVNEKTVSVTKNNIRTELTSGTIIIDTGAKPVIPQINGLNNVDYLTSETILDLQTLPEHLVILGGGYISLEFAQMFTRFGSKVTVIEQNTKFLPREDNDIADEVKKILEGENVTILTGTRAESVSAGGRKIQIRLSTKDKTRNLSATHLLVAVGIKPALEKLALQKAGIKTDEKGFIKVNNALETNVKGIYAVGDVKGGPAFTHISYDDYRVLYNNLTKRKKQSIKCRPIPYVLYTDPELARIGLTEEEALKQGYRIQKAVMPMTYSARAVETGETRGVMKAIVDAKTEKILGCAFLGTNAGEIMSIIEVAIMSGMKYTRLKDAIFAHPTLAESLNSLFSMIK